MLTSEISQIEKHILSNIDLEKGPDNMQMNLAVKLNIFKLFSLQVSHLQKKTYYI